MHHFDVMVADRYAAALTSDARMSAVRRDRRRRRAQRPHRRRLPGPRRQARRRARAPLDPRRRVRHRGGLARASASRARRYVVSHAQPADRRRPRAQALRLRGRPARPAVRHLRRRRPADPLPQRRPPDLRVDRARLEEGRRRDGRLRRPHGARRGVPAPADDAPAAGARLQASPRDLASLLREAGRAAGLGAQGPARAVPRDDHVGRRPARRLLRDRRAQGRVRVAPASSACGPARARPAPRTTCSTTTSARSTASPAPGATCAAGWAASARRSRPAPAPPAPTSARTPTVASIDVRDGAVTGVTLERRRGAARARSCSPARTRAARSSTSSAPSTSRTRSPRRCGATRRAAGPSRSTPCCPSRRATRMPATQRAAAHAAWRSARAIDYLERAWQDATRGVPAAEPYIEVEVPTSIDPTLTDDGTTILTMFTQYGPWSADDWGEGDREAYGQRCFDILARHAPNVRRRAAALRGARPAGPRGDLRPRGRLDLPGRAGPRPDGVHAAVPGDGAVRDAGRRPVPVRRRDAPGRRRDGRGRPQRRQARAGRRSGARASAAALRYSLP